MEKKRIELWDGYEVEFDGALFDDLDFAADLSDAINTDDIRTLVTMYMALVGGEETYKIVRKHIEEVHGHFSMEAISDIMEKINNCFPKVGNRASRRSWKNSR